MEKELGMKKKKLTGTTSDLHFFYAGHNLHKLNTGLQKLYVDVHVTCHTRPHKFECLRDSSVTSEDILIIYFTGKECCRLIPNK